LTVTSPVSANGATQISGLGVEPPEGECTDLASDLTLKMTGDLKGCLYITVEEYEISPSGTYRERGSEIFVGTYGGEYGRFETTYLFTAKFDDAGQKFGRCQHPIVTGSGEGVFEGVSGRFDIQDNIVGGVAVNFPYTGHLRW
jgi:hypothetical protein